MTKTTIFAAVMALALGSSAAMAGEGEIFYGPKTVAESAGQVTQPIQAVAPVVGQSHSFSVRSSQIPVQRQQDVQIGADGNG